MKDGKYERNKELMLDKKIKSNQGRMHERQE